MFKHKVIAFILLAAVFISGKAYCQQEIKDRQISTVSGTVTDLDTAGDVLSVQTDKGMMMFYISVESNLFQSTHHIASIEILKGDPVTIQYASTASGKNIIIELVDSKPNGS